MGKFTTKITGFKKLSKKLKELGSPVNKADLNKMGKATIKEMKRLISKGKFPLQGGGFRKKFPKYKRGKDKDGYPNTVKKKFPNKKRSPVNLKLSGDFLKDLKYNVTKKNEITIGYRKGKQQKKESGHREGVNTQPKRPTIPVSSKRESFAKSVQKKYLDILRDKIKRITKRKN